MAKPIRATPELRGEEANEFLRKMAEVEKTGISEIDRKLAMAVKSNSRFFESIESIQLS